MKRPAPVITEDAAAFWEGTGNHQLLLQRCDECSAVQFPHRVVCTSCGSRKLVVVEAAGTGTVYSFTEVRRPPAPEFQEYVPYVVALVDLDEGPRMMTNLVGESGTPSVGMRVTVDFDTDNEYTFAVFRPLSDEA
jgi:uncharacterized OB-fold protein